MRWWIIGAVLLTGCVDAKMADFGSYGAKSRVELWSGGQKVHEWTSTGKVLNEQSSDGYYFRDSDTGKLVRVTGDVVIAPVE